MDNYSKTWKELELLIKKKEPTSVCMLEMIEFLKAEMNKKTYEKLIKLDFQTEVKDVQELIISELNNNPLPKYIKGIWFGISKYMDEKTNTEYYAFSLAGSKSFNVKNNEWASELDYEINCKIFLLGTMNEIDLIIKNDPKICELGEWILPLAYYSLIINQCFLDNDFKKAFFGSKKKPGIAVGYDEGDYLHLEIK